MSARAGRRGMILAAAALLASAVVACSGDDTADEGDSGVPAARGAASSAATRRTSSTEAPSTTADTPDPVTPATTGGGGAPVVHFADLQSGPSTGGEGGAGVFVTITGTGFGDERGSSTVTFGGGEVHAYPVWTDGEVVVQVGSQASTGDVVVHTSGGDSNGVPFAVRDGGIHFVAPDGDDDAGGSRDDPWATVTHAVDTMRPGDVTYILDGVGATEAHRFDASLSVETSGEPDLPIALAAYPGATATIGGDTLEFGARVPNLGEGVTDWVISHLVLRGRVTALEIGGIGSDRWRVVGNDISCPAVDVPGHCFAASLADDVAFLGNEVHDVAADLGHPPSKQHHAVYFTTDTNHVEVGWNHLHDNYSCRGIQFHSSPLDEGGETGLNQHDIWVHDNLIDGSVCDGINLATVDPSQGPVRVTGNMIRHAGSGPMPPDGDANYACIHVATITNAGPDGTGSVEISGNVLEDCGARGGGDAGAISRGTGSPGLRVRLEGNTITQQPGESYVSASTPLEMIDDAGTNTWEGAGRYPCGRPGPARESCAWHTRHLQTRRA